MKNVIGLILFFALSTFAQSGEIYQISRSVIASGGGVISGGSFAVTATSGQGSAGETSQGGAFSVNSGFWTPIFAPTAASVAVSGKVLTPSGAGLVNAIVFLSDSNGQTRSARTSPFGYYSFEGVEVGQTYIVSVRSKRFQFSTQVVTVLETIEELNFTALP